MPSLYPWAIAFSSMYIYMYIEIREIFTIGVGFTYVGERYLVVPEI